MLFVLLYGFLVWAGEAVYYAVTQKRFVNRGLLTLPIDLEYGIIFGNVAVVLPTLGRNYLGMYLLTFANLILVRGVLGFFRSRVTRRAKWMEDAPSGTRRSLILNLLIAAGILILSLLLQPLFMLLTSFIPTIAQNVIGIVALVLIAIDFITVLIAVKKGASAFEKAREKGKTDELSDSIARFVWRRLEKAYPGINEDPKRTDIVFAKGMSMDKLVWVFLIWALVGDIIETFYCRITAGKWMSRSSVVFGPFSFVWGIGAVLLTLCLMRLKDKKNRWILLAGAILGGAFEYMCSVFTEVMFGKVFWDYSKMPLNIGGRTNLFFMAFWGILGVIWVRIAYPPLDKFIEKFPPVAAKIATWVIVALMSFNAVFTVAVMMRYNTRQTRPEANNVLEQFIDNTYDDAYVEHRWQNMSSK